jgi:hypothetical protein
MSFLKESIGGRFRLLVYGIILSRIFWFQKPCRLSDG